MKHILFAGLTLTLLLMAGCQVVHVTDQHGQPVGWADVSVVTQSGDPAGLPVKTDYTFGNATLPMSQSAPGAREWLIISKEGYVTRRLIRPEDSPVEIQMMKTQSAPK